MKGFNRFVRLIWSGFFMRFRHGASYYFWLENDIVCDPSIVTLLRVDTSNRVNVCVNGSLLGSL